MNPARINGPFHVALARPTARVPFRKSAWNQRQRARRANTGIIGKNIIAPAGSTAASLQRNSRPAIANPIVALRLPHDG